MRRLKLFPIVSLLLAAGLLAGCNHQPQGMKNQPTNLKSGEIKINLPGKKKPFDAGY